MPSDFNLAVPLENQFRNLGDLRNEGIYGASDFASSDGVERKVVLADAGATYSCNTRPATPLNICFLFEK